MRRWARGTRARIALASSAILALALLIAGGAVVGSLSYAQRYEADTSLASHAEIIATGLEESNGDVGFGHQESFSETTAGIAIDSAIVGPRGVAASSTRQPLATATLERAAAEARRAGPLWQDAMDARGLARRLYAKPLDGTPTAAVLVVSRSVAEANAALARTAAALAIVSLVLIAGGAALTYWMAGRALRPVRTIASLARSLGGGDLHRRVDIAVPDDELGELVATFNEMLARLEASFESLRRFTADASHELRAPLALLRSELDQALGRERSGPEYRATLALLRDEVDRIARLADQLLVLARADAGALIPHLEPVDVVDMLHEAAARWSRRAGEAHARIEVVTPDTGTVRAEPALLRRVIDNLLDNALRYAPSGSAVTLSAERGPAEWRIAVRDLGRGIPETHRPELFRRFARPDEARSREHGGAGLGLALSAAVAVAHGGRLELLPGSAGVGTTFRLTLPDGAGRPR